MGGERMSRLILVPSSTAVKKATALTRVTRFRNRSLSQHSDVFEVVALFGKSDRLPCYNLFRAPGETADNLHERRNINASLFCLRYAGEPINVRRGIAPRSYNYKDDRGCVWCAVGFAVRRKAIPLNDVRELISNFDGTDKGFEWGIKLFVDGR